MKKIFKIPILLIGILLICVSLFLYSNKGNKEDKNKPKPVDNTPKVLLETSFKDKSDEEIYKALVDSKERVGLDSIKGDNDTIVVNSFKLLASHYSNAYVDSSEDTNSGITYCELLGLISYSKEHEGFNSLCLANIKYKQVDAITEDGSNDRMLRIGDKKTVDTLNSYGIDLDINKMSVDCATYKFKNEECNDDNNYILSIIYKELYDNSYAMDVEYIKRESYNKYTVKLNGYHLKNDSTVVHSEEKDHFEYTVSVKDGHIVFN